MKLSVQKQFRQYLNTLDSRGLICQIVRHAKKNYEVIINFEVVKRYKTRRSCKRYIVKTAKSIL